MAIAIELMFAGGLAFIGIMSIAIGFVVSCRQNTKQSKDKANASAKTAAAVSSANAVVPVATMHKPAPEAPHLQKLDESADLESPITVHTRAEEMAGLEVPNRCISQAETVASEVPLYDVKKSTDTVSSSSPSEMMVDETLPLLITKTTPSHTDAEHSQSESPALLVRDDSDSTTFTAPSPNDRKRRSMERQEWWQSALHNRKGHEDAEPAPPVPYSASLLSIQSVKRKNEVGDTIVEEDAETVRSMSLTVPNYRNLTHLLHDSLGKRALLEFLISVHSAENLLFYFTVNKFARDYQAEVAEEIFLEYIQVNSRGMVNISGERQKAIRTEILKMRETGEVTQKLKDLLQKAKTDIYVMIETDLFPRFLLSPISNKWREANGVELVATEVPLDCPVMVTPSKRRSSLTSAIPIPFKISEAFKRSNT